MLGMVCRLGKGPPDWQIVCCSPKSICPDSFFPNLVTGKGRIGIKDRIFFLNITQHDAHIGFGNDVAGCRSGIPIGQGGDDLIGKFTCYLLTNQTMEPLGKFPYFLFHLLIDNICHCRFEPTNILPWDSFLFSLCSMFEKPGQTQLGNRIPCSINKGKILRVGFTVFFGRNQQLKSMDKHSPGIIR